MPAEPISLRRRLNINRLTVPFGLRHISFRLNSLTLASSGVMVAHLTPTEYFWMASADSTVTWSFVWTYQHIDDQVLQIAQATHSISVLHTQVIVFEVHVDIRQN